MLKNNSHDELREKIGELLQDLSDDSFYEAFSMEHGNKYEAPEANYLQRILDLCQAHTNAKLEKFNSILGEELFMALTKRIIPSHTHTHLRGILKAALERVKHSK